MQLKDMKSMMELLTLKEESFKKQQIWVDTVRETIGREAVKIWEATEDQEAGEIALMWLNEKLGERPIFNADTPLHYLQKDIRKKRERSAQSNKGTNRIN